MVENKLKNKQNNTEIRRIAIASEEKTADSIICNVSGRAPFYLIFENKKLVKTIKNPFAKGGGGAGLGVVQMLHNENVNLIVSGQFGENMIQSLKEKKMNYLVQRNNKISQIIKDI